MSATKWDLSEARLCGDYDDKETFQAADILKKAGFRVSTAPVEGLGEPVLTADARTFYGLAEIKALAETVRQTGKVP